MVVLTFREPNLLPWSVTAPVGSNGNGHRMDSGPRFSPAGMKEEPLPGSHTDPLILPGSQKTQTFDRAEGNNQICWPRGPPWVPPPPLLGELEDK